MNIKWHVDGGKNAAIVVEDLKEAQQLMFLVEKWKENYNRNTSDPIHKIILKEEIMLHCMLKRLGDLLEDIIQNWGITKGDQR